jgi:hypothetical protein
MASSSATQLAAPLIAETRRNFEQQLARKEAEFGKREASLRQSQQELAKARKAIDDEVAKRLRTERSAIVEADAAKARLALSVELEQRDRQLAALQQNLIENNTKLAAAQQAQLDVMRKSRELDDARRELELSVETKVQESLTAVREKARLDAEEGLKTRLSEKERQIAGMQRRIEDLLRKAEQGSQQTQGEALDLESSLCCRFPRDLIDPVATSCSACSAIPVRFVERSFGKASAPRPGTITGSRNCATTSAWPRVISR